MLTQKIRQTCEGYTKQQITNACEQIKKETGGTQPMQIKEVYVEIKRSKNYQTYTVGMTATINEQDKTEMELTRELQTKCRQLAMEQVSIDDTTKKIPFKED